MTFSESLLLFYPPPSFFYIYIPPLPEEPGPRPVVLTLIFFQSWATIKYAK